MNHSEQLKDVLAEGCIIRRLEDDIYSALPVQGGEHVSAHLKAATYRSRERLKDKPLTCPQNALESVELPAVLNGDINARANG